VKWASTFPLEAFSRIGLLSIVTVPTKMVVSGYIVGACPVSLKFDIIRSNENVFPTARTDVQVTERLALLKDVS
jgi:hypothetical protein